MSDSNLPETLTFNDINIPIPANYEVLYVPVKPICQIIDTDYKKQDNWLKKDEYFSQLYTLRYTTGADGKRYKMRCLPMIDVATWVASIGNDNKTPEQIAKKTNFLKWFRGQLLKLFKGMNLILEENKAEVRLLEKIEEDEDAYESLTSEANFFRDRINHNLKALDEIRSKRFSPQYELEFKPRLED